MKFLLAKLTPVALVAVCLVWLGVGVYSYFSASALIAAQEAEARTRQVLLLLETFFSDLKDVAMAQRGFVLTGQEDYLLSHSAALQQIAPKLDELRPLLAGNSAQQERLAQLAQLAQQRIALSQQIVETRRQQGFDSAVALVRKNEGLPLMNEVRRLVKELEAEELGLLKMYEASTGHRAWRTLNALVAINLLALLFIGLAFNTLRLELRRSRHAEAGLQRAKAGLEQRVAERTMELTETNAQLRREAADRIEAETNLRESEERFSKAFTASPHLMTISTLAEGRYLAVNDAVLRATGYARIEMIGHTAEELRIFAEPEGRTRLLGAFRDGSVRDLEIRLRMKEGRVRTVLLSAEVITVNAEQCILTVSQDITARKQAEEQLRRSEERLRLAQTAARVGTWEYDPTTGATFWSTEAYTLFGIDPTALDFYAVWRARIHPDDAQRAQAIIAECLATGTAEVEYRYLHPTEGLRWIYRKAGLQTDARSQQLMFGVSFDITERKLAEDALRESEERFRTLTDSAPVLIWVNDVNAGCEFVNRAYLEFFGQRLEEVQGLGWQPYLHPEDAEHYINSYLAAFAARQPFHGQTRARRADGEWRWLDSHGLPRFAPSGEFLGYVGSSPDITETKRAELDAQFLTGIGESIHLADDAEELMGQVAAAVGAHLQVAQCFFTEVEAARDRFTIHRDYHAQAPSLAGSYQRSDFSPAVIAELSEGRTVIVTDTAHDPRTAPYQTSYDQVGIGAFAAAPLLRAGRQVSSLIISAQAAREWTAREIALLKTVAERAWLAVEKLRAEAEMVRLFKQEQAARAHAEAANRSKDEFLAVLSHELRSPLNAIIGWNRILSGKQHADPEIAKVTEIIDRNARTQLQLIEDLLDTARLITGKLKLELQPVALIEVISAALDVVRPAAQAKEMQLQTEFALEDCQINGDPARLQQIIWNLLSNSIKFTPAGGRITVALHRADTHVEIAIRDTGKGIAPDFLPYVFDRFAQADGSSSRRFGGLGLGLSLVHHLVEIHGGTITASSAGEGQGATFTIKLPLRPLAQAVAVAPLSQEDRTLYGVLPATLLSLKGVRALVVDDEPDARELIAATLNNYAAAEVRAVASGAEALQILREWTPGAPSILICDIGLPGEDGYEVIRKVRALKPAPGGAIKAIALTAFGRPEDRLRALQAGFQMHVAKPVEPTELVVVINTLLGNRQ